MNQLCLIKIHVGNLTRQLLSKTDNLPSLGPTPQSPAQGQGSVVVMSLGRARVFQEGGGGGV